MTTDNKEEENYCSCKVGESSWKCNLPGLPFEIGTYWNQETSPQWSIDAITKYLNRQFILAFCEEGSMDPIEGEAELYRSLLMDDDVSEGAQEEARGKLERQGINIDALEKCLVTRTTVYRHMQNCLEIEYQEPSLTTEEAIDQISESIDRFRKSASNLFSQYHQEGDDFRVSVNLNVVCENCGDIYDGFAFINQNGCDCTND